MKRKGGEEEITEIDRRNGEIWEIFGEREESMNFYRAVELSRGKYIGGVLGLLLRLEGSENYILCHLYGAPELLECPWSEGGRGGVIGVVWGVWFLKAELEGGEWRCRFRERKIAGNWRRAGRWVLIGAGRGWLVNLTIWVIDFNWVVNIVTSNFRNLFTITLLSMISWHTSRLYKL
jgi:hypothetical protein